MFNHRAPFLTPCSIAGEGGTFALFHGLYPPQRVDYSKDRVLTGDFISDPDNHYHSRDLLRRLRWPLLIWVGYIDILSAFY